MKNNELQNIDNYNKNITNDEIEIYIKYTHVIAQYLLFGIETIKNHNSEYVKYILNKGLFTISYVFKMLLMYTCNLELAYHHCQKSYSYYIEFIGQIGDDAVTYLQLNSKDAALFVYKKTIFEIPDQIKTKYYEKNADENKNKIVSYMIDIYNKLIETEIVQLKPEQLKTTECINNMYTNIGHINSKMYKLYYSNYSNTIVTANITTTTATATTVNATTVNATAVNATAVNATTVNATTTATITTANEYQEKEKEKEFIQNVFFSRLTYIKRFCDILILKKMSNEDSVDYYKDYIKILEYFIKKIRKINLSENFDTNLIIKSFSIEFEEKIKLYNPLKFVNWIFLP